MKDELFLQNINTCHVSKGAPEPAVFLKPRGLPTRGEHLVLVTEDRDDVKKPIRDPLPVSYSSSAESSFPTSKKRSPPVQNAIDFKVPATTKYEEIALATEVLPVERPRPRPTFGPSNKPKRESKSFQG